MTDCNALEALFPWPRYRILAAFFGEPERWWSLVELAGRAGVQPRGLSQHVTPLRKCGILREKRVGRHSLLQPDPTHPVFTQLQSLVVKLSSSAEREETILVVEDQPATAQITRILLESWGYKVLEAHSGREALRIFEEQKDNIRLLVSDVHMPEISGLQLAEELQRRNPELRVIFMSGYSSDELAGRQTTFLPKPFNPASLSRIVRKEIGPP